MLQDVKECEKSLDSGHGSMEEISHSEVSVPIFIHRDNILCRPVVQLSVEMIVNSKEKNS